jgi:hypothetical protein
LEVGHLTTFWIIIIIVAVVVAIINFAIAAVRRKELMVALVRGLAGLLSLLLAAGILVGKAIVIQHPYLRAQDVFIGFGVFVFAVLLLPTYVERGRDTSPKVTIQERAARPVNATVRLRDAKSSDEWVN